MMALKAGQKDITEGKVRNIEEAKATLDSWFTK